MLYYLMIKEIVQTGLKYLCKKKYNKDPNAHLKYKGSGVYWNRVLKAHPEYTITTTVLGLFNEEELIKNGLYYSRLWNIVESKEWANLIDESGDGGDTSKTPGFLKAKKERKLGTGAKKCKGKKRYHNPVTKEIVDVLPGEIPPKGFVKGGIKNKFNYGPKKGECEVYNDGTRKIYVKKGDPIPEGFVKGLHYIGTTKNRIGYYNPETGKKKYIKKGDPIPEGFVKGIKPTSGKRIKTPYGIYENIISVEREHKITRYNIFKLCNDVNNEEWELLDER